MTVVRRWPQAVWLLVVWLLLWGRISPTIVVGGILVAIGVIALFPLPLLPRLPVRPWRLLQLAGYLLADLVRSGWEVGREALRPHSRAGILAVPLLTRSQRVVTLIAASVALTPGSFVLQIDRAGGLLYVYAIGLRGPADVSRVRDRMRRLQARVVAAVGPREEDT